MQPSLTVELLSKRYGDVTAVDRLSFSAQPGSVTALIGPNGSGKSTTMKAMLGLVMPSGGQTLVNGLPYRDLDRPLTVVGALLDAGAVNAGFTGRNHLRWLAVSNGLPASRIDMLLDHVGLARAARRRVGGYSLGMKQRLGIAAALVGDPDVLILDEPMNGLDPEGMVWLRGFLRERAATGRIVLLSSHLMGEIEGTADHVVVIGQGRLIASTSVEELLNRDSAAEATVVHSHQPSAVMVVLANAGANVTSTGADTIVAVGIAPERVARLLGQHELEFHGLGAQRPSLEDVYLELTRDATLFATQKENAR
jgi:ABC-2 type transport system ATP-binding protein